MTGIIVIVGETSNLVKGTYIDGYGIKATNFTSTVRPVAYLAIDQGTNIIVIDMAGLLNETLITLVSWPRDSWTEVTTGLGESWKKAYSKEQFTIQMEEYPVLRAYSV